MEFQQEMINWLLRGSQMDMGQGILFTGRRAARISKIQATPFTLQAQFIQTTEKAVLMI